MPDAGLVLITGGGTGGHVFPGLAAAEALRGLGARVHWLGTRAGMESKLVPRAGIPISYLRVSGMRGKARWQQLFAPVLLAGAVLQALVIILRLRPSCVLGTGGFVAGPGGLAAWLLRRPLVVHEQNAVAGTTNRLLARFARRILLGIPGAFAGNPRAEFVGNPVRASIGAIEAPRQRLRDGAGRALRVLVVGGSQGARVLNEVLPHALATMAPNMRPEVWHQTGEREHASCRRRYEELGVTARIEAFIDDMVGAYTWADLVVCRAGALTVSELAAAGAAAILVPLPTAIDDHQRLNARWLADAGAALCIDQSRFDAGWLGARLEHFGSSRAEVRRMAECARELARADAAAVVARVCLEVAR